VPLIDPDASEFTMNGLDEASAYFLRAIKQHYTRDTAVDVMEALTSILGKDWKGRLIFGIMANRHSTIRQLRISKNVTDGQVQKINAIKEVRYVTGLGLTEAKNLVENAYFNDQTVMVREKPEGMEQTSWDQAIMNSIGVIRHAGFRVEFA
jgi:hypothetical protein